MSSYAYGKLVLPVVADTRQVETSVPAAAKRAGDAAAKSLNQRINSSLGKGAKELGSGIATALGTGVLALTAFGAKSIKVAAGVEKMQTALNAMAKANGLSTAAVQGSVSALRKQGLTVEAAQSVTADFVKAHINLRNATRLSTVAQNASILSGKSVSDVMEGIAKAVETGNVRQLRSAGIIVNTKTAYADMAEKVGTTAAKLTQAQKQTALMNAVMEEGGHIAGTWAATLNDPARVLASFPRIAHDIQVSVGEQLLKGFGPLISGIGRIARGLRDSLVPGGALAPLLAGVGKAATQLLAPLTQVVNLVANWMEHMKPGEIGKVTDQLVKFAPSIAAVATALGAFAGGKYLTKIPIIGEMFGSLGGPLGIVVTGLATLALTSPQAKDALMGLATVLMKSLAPVLAELTPIIGVLGQDLASLLGAGLRALMPLIPPLVKVLEAALAVIIALLPEITFLANLVARFAPELVYLAVGWYAVTSAITLYNAIAGLAWLSTIRVTVANLAENASLILLRIQLAAMATWTGIVRVATMLWTAAQWLLNAALDANPIGIVIVALAALGAALYLAWTRSATFRNIVIGAWQAVAGFVIPIIHTIGNVIGSVFQAIGNVIGAVSGAVVRNWRTALTILLALTTGGMSLIVQLIISKWSAIRQFISNILGTISSIVSTTWRNMVAGAGLWFSNLSNTISGWWKTMVRNATSAGGSIIAGLKSGITGAMGAIGSWVKKSIVDPLIGAVKGFFGIHSPSTVMAGIGGNLVKGLFVGLVPGMRGVGSLVGQVFGSFPNALGAMIGHGLVGIASLPGKALNALMGLFGGGNAGALATTANKYNGHRYVWGGGANAASGFDCSSFVNMLSGMLGLPIPGGFHAPSAQHGPVTTGWLGTGMQRISQSAMRINDLFVSNTHMGVVTGPGRGFAARSTATGTGPQPVGGGYDILRFAGKGPKVPAWLQGVMGKIGGIFSHLFGGGGTDPGKSGGGGASQWRGVAMQVLNMFGRPDLLGPMLLQIGSESGGNQYAQNNWDSNAKAGTPSKGLLQVIDPTFAANAGPFRNLGIFNPLANLYAATAYALKRYGASLASVWGHGHGYAAGGVIGEHVVGIGQQSGTVYHIGEAGPELVSPLSGPNAGAGGGGRTVINVYPSAGMNERELAALVSRELAWATAGGMT